MLKKRRGEDLSQVCITLGGVEILSVNLILNGNVKEKKKRRRETKIQKFGSSLYHFRWCGKQPLTLAVVLQGVPRPRGYCS